MAGPNWARLYHQGRCKAVGVPWTQEEAEAAGALGIPANYVRAGVVTLEAYDAILEKEAKNGPALETMTRNELALEAEKMGLVLSEQTSDSEYRYQVLVAQNAKKAAKPKKAVEPKEVKADKEEAKPKAKLAEAKPKKS